MQGEAEKVSAGHLKRNAYLYVRQSTLRQVVENSESTKRQYALRQRAIALGWHPDRIVVIDSDLGQSGASAAEREGFQKLVGEVGMGHVGLVLYDAQGHVLLDPDQQVQNSIRFLFQSFRRVGSAGAVVKAFRDGKLLFPHRPRGGPQDGELV
jgi:hypothetical protein